MFFQVIPPIFRQLFVNLLLICGHTLIFLQYIPKKTTILAGTTKKQGGVSKKKTFSDVNPINRKY
jgi:hypothetical protein